jgi:hypothetical protein
MPSLRPAIGGARLVGPADRDTACDTNRRPRKQLQRRGVDDVHFGPFDGTHGGIDYRSPLSLAYLADRLPLTAAAPAAVDPSSRLSVPSPGLVFFPECAAPP